MAPTRVRKRRGKRKALPADAQERDDRLKDALRYRRTTSYRFCEQHGLTAATLRRWVQRGDALLREPTTGVAITTVLLAESLQMHPAFLRPGGASLWRWKVGEVIGVPDVRPE